MIIGGGSSGLAAAKILHENNVTFLLLEAQEYLGGRIKHLNFNGYIVEDGANWIHGQHASQLDPLISIENPVWTFKNKYKINGNFTDYEDGMLFLENGHVVNKSLSDRCAEDLRNGLDYCRERRNRLWEEATKDDLETSEIEDISIKQCLVEYGYFKTDNRSNLELQVRNNRVWEEMHFKYAIDSPSLMNSFDVNHVNEIEYNDEDFLITDQRGYNMFLKEIGNTFIDNIRLKEKVITVDYDEDDVTIRTETGLTVDAGFAICTLPLGVLQKNEVIFTPSFSKEKEKGIHGMKMGYYAKVYLQFPYNFWGNKETLWFDGYPNESLNWALNLDHEKYFLGSNMISFHVTDYFAVDIESQAINRTENEIMIKIRSVYGRTVPNPVGIHVTNWTNNPFSYGSYSAWPMGYTKHSWEQMRKNEGRLYFAGEHTSDGFGFVHAAFETGTSIALNIVSVIRGKH